MSFTEFCCKSGGSNLNSGTRTGSSTEPGTSPDITFTAGTWVNSTRVYTVASGNTGTLAVGDFVSIYTSGATVTGYVARVTAVTSTTFTTSSTSAAGTKPADGTYDARVGGAWQGPNGATPWIDSFPGQNNLNVAGNSVRVNLKNDQTYSITAGISIGTGDVQHIQGYTTSYGDGGRAVIDGGTSGASYILLTVGATSFITRLCDLEFRNNGATGSAVGVSLSGNGTLLQRCVVHDVRGSGFAFSISNNSMLVECEAYNCGQNNATHAGFSTATGSAVGYLRCIAHDNTGSTVSGFSILGNVLAYQCISDSNGLNGFSNSDAANPAVLENCDSYNNTGAGLAVSGSGGYVAAANCNFVKNGTYGVNKSAVGSRASITNCGFGSGTQVNTSGATNGNLDDTGSITYASGVTPWTDPANGDFRISLAASYNTGYGGFLQTAASYAGTVGRPDVGAAQHYEAPGGSGGKGTGGKGGGKSRILGRRLPGSALMGGL